MLHTHERWREREHMLTAEREREEQDARGRGALGVEGERWARGREKSHGAMGSGATLCGEQRSWSWGVVL
jgi:hypothetical protein